MSVAEVLEPITRRVEARFDAGPAPHKIGLIALSSDMVTERDFKLMLPGDEVMFYTARLRFDTPVTVENLRAMGPRIAEAAEKILPTSRLDVIAYSCTSGTVSIGYDEVVRQVRAGRPGVEVATPISSAIHAMRHLGVKRISLLTPYIDEVNQRMRGFFEDWGIEVLNVAGFCLEDDQDMARLTPDAIHDAAAEICDARADGIFVSCTGIRSAETIGRIERTLGKPALCSNQAMFWEALRMSGYAGPVGGFGSLLAQAA